MYKEIRDRGSPCLVPLSKLRYPVEFPLFTTQLCTLQNVVLTHCKKSGPKPNFFSTEKIKLCSTESKAFSLSSAESMPSRFSWSAGSNMSSVTLTDSPMYLPLTFAF